MNEYTRREEVRWTLIASLALVVCIAPAVLLLVTAKGKTVPDPAARERANVAAVAATTAHSCSVAADKLATEIEVFKESAKAARIADPVDAPDAGAPPPTKGAQKKGITAKIREKLKEIKEKDERPDVSLAWPAALPSQKAAKLLAPCRTATEATANVRPETAPVWDAVAKAAAINPAADDKNDEIAQAKNLLKILSDIPIDKVTAQVHDAETAAKAAQKTAEDTADKATVVAGIPDGLIPRRLAVGIGVGLTVIALLLSYLSVRVASNRRLATLVPLREAAKNSQPGLHAAAVLRLAAAPNGGLPGAVIGGALGGLIAAAVLPVDTDVFIGGVMAGFLLGMGMQFAFRMASGASRWRQRAGELADIEKPAIPIVLALSGVNPGLEGPFITFFVGLSPAEAASTVEKLAAQAEERILAAADAGAAGGAPQQPGIPGMPQ